MPRAIQTFEVSLKAFIERDRRILLLQEADTGYWELPGGRIDVGEERVPQMEILAREIREELGADFRCNVGAEAVTWVRERPADQAFLFILARNCAYVAGEILLSDEHAAFKWTTPEDWPTLAFPPRSDYLHGLERLWQLS